MMSAVRNYFFPVLAESRSLYILGISKYCNHCKPSPERISYMMAPLTILVKFVDSGVTAADFCRLDMTAESATESAIAEPVYCKKEPMDDSLIILIRRSKINWFIHFATSLIRGD